MEVSGEVADLLVREGLQVAEVALRLSGSGIVNAAALITALLKENYKLSGRVGIDRLNKENAESVVVPIRAEDMSRFKELAGKFGVLYAAVEKTADSKGVIHIISNANYAAQLNAVLSAMSYPMFGKGKAEESPKKEKPRSPPEKSSGEHATGCSVQKKEDKPSVREHLEKLRETAKVRDKPQKTREKQR